MRERVLIVDDDPVQRRLLDDMVRKFGYEPIVAAGGDAAVAALTATDSARIDAVVLDLIMPDLDGLGMLAKMRAAGLVTPVIVQTSRGGIDNLVTAMRAGATDFVIKPVGAERLQVSLRNALVARALAAELARFTRRRSGTLSCKDIIAKSPRMAAALRAAEKAAASTMPVLLEGPSGVGKELIARAIHGSGERRAKPFVALDCGAIADDLLEPLLFGHDKDGFTSAGERRVGKFVDASGGTLFLDEVGELPLAAQAKLMRVIRDGEVEPVAARRRRKVDVRLISATNRDLIADVKAGRFREDLFYRLHVLSIAVPALRERREDIPELARHFLARFAAEEGKRTTRIGAEAMALLSAYHWPGNVRQLENAMFRAVALAQGDLIGLDEFPQIAAQISGYVTTASVAPELGGSQPACARPPSAESPPAAAEAGSHAPPFLPSVAAATPPAGALALLDGNGDMRPLDDIEADAIRFAITHYRGQMSEVARRLRIGRSTLYRKLDSLELDTGVLGGAAL
jgi:DNA-binding NtrC family response regulator